MFLAIGRMSNRGKTVQQDFVFFHVVSTGEGERRYVVGRILMSALVCVPKHGVTQGASFK